MAKKPQPISSFKPGEEVQGFYLVVEKSMRKTRSGSSYLDLVLRDRSGTVSAKVWEGADALSAGFKTGDAVVVKGRTDLFKDRLQLNVDKIARVRKEHSEHGFSPEALSPVSSRDVDEMWSEALSLIDSISGNHIKSVLEVIFKQNREHLSSFPAAKFYHHNVIGGLLEHMLAVANDCLYFTRKYPDLDRDLLLAGALLHDIGKVRELTGEVVTEYTDEGNFIGHIVIGRDMVRDAASGIEDFPDELLTKLDHLILSHQGRYEYSSPRRPMTKEALVLHFVDELDAKMYIFSKAVEEDQAEGKWTSRENYFGIPLFKG